MTTALVLSQRARILRAITDAVAENGYAGLTVGDIVARAGVSRRTFYEQFENKEECFLAAYGAGAQIVIDDIRGAIDGVLLPGSDWRDVAREALAVYTRALASQPEFARVFLVDVLGAGPHALARRLHVHELFVEQWRALAMLASYQDESIGVVPDIALRALVGGTGELVQRHVLREGAETLEELAPELAELAIRLIESEGR